jgi:legumain
VLCVVCNPLDIFPSFAYLVHIKFLAVITGDEATTGGKVLKSDANSEVFIYYTDHGGPNLIALPTGGYLCSDQLSEALQTMQKNKMFN